MGRGFTGDVFFGLDPDPDLPYPSPTASQNPGTGKSFPHPRSLGDYPGLAIPSSSSWDISSDECMKSLCLLYPCTFLYFSAMLGILCLHVQVTKFWDKMNETDAILSGTNTINNSKGKHNLSMGMFKACKTVERRNRKAQPKHGFGAQSTTLLNKHWCAPQLCKSLDAKFSPKIESQGSLAINTSQTHPKHDYALACYLQFKTYSQGLYGIFWGNQRGQLGFQVEIKEGLSWMS